jgi:hypothetical protein
MANFIKRLFGKPGGGEGGPPPVEPGGPPAGRFANDRARMFDLEQSRVLNAQLHVPPADREENWGGHFFPPHGSAR